MGGMRREGGRDGGMRIKVILSAIWLPDHMGRSGHIRKAKSGNAKQK
jgi:hypothetical protein